MRDNRTGTEGCVSGHLRGIITPGRKLGRKSHIDQKYCPWKLSETLEQTVSLWNPGRPAGLRLDSACWQIQDLCPQSIHGLVGSRDAWTGLRQYFFGMMKTGAPGKEANPKVKPGCTGPVYVVGFRIFEDHDPVVQLPVSMMQGFFLGLNLRANGSWTKIAKTVSQITSSH